MNCRAADPKPGSISAQRCSAQMACLPALHHMKCRLHLEPSWARKRKEERK
ncbi:hypothetical protein ABG768_025836, partial [Culter alburnus]